MNPTHKEALLVSGLGSNGEARFEVSLGFIKRNVPLLGGMMVLWLFAGCAHTQPVTLGISADGTITVAGRPCSESELVARLSELGSRSRHGVLVRADTNAPFRQVVTVIDACKAAGVQPVTTTTGQ